MNLRSAFLRIAGDASVQDLSHTEYRKRGIMAKTTVSESVVSIGINKNLPILDDTTTSRVVVNNPLLRHVFFTFGEGQVLTDHASARAVIVNILEGKFDFTVGGTKNIVTAGDVIYLAPGERHALTALEPSRMSLTLIDVESMRQTQDGDARDTQPDSCDPSHRGHHGSCGCHGHEGHHSEHPQEQGDSRLEQQDGDR